jgi:hypothetical protein
MPMARIESANSDGWARGEHAIKVVDSCPPR